MSRGKRRAAPALASAALLWVTLGCDPTKELRVQQSAGGVLRALEQLRKADNSEKGKALSGLSRAPCQGEGVCELRDACRDAYALHVEGVSLTQAAKQHLADGKELEAARLVGAAEQKLNAARGEVAACLDQAASLRRRYQLE